MRLVLNLLLVGVISAISATIALVILTDPWHILTPLGVGPDWGEFGDRLYILWALLPAAALFYGPITGVLIYLIFLKNYLTDPLQIVRATPRLLAWVVFVGALSWIGAPTILLILCPLGLIFGALMLRLRLKGQVLVNPASA